ncbi:c-type cytochrome [Bordetella hinzii]|jgi:adenylosuccinate lyase|uniref:Cytochrome C n=2 Tax=Bordetella hinzii TaxID=103855 RepID=A0AAN1RY38_9BORD|nr:cytochrome c [Bordetella hinzii]AKQ56203.1 Cytochrome c' [Bordetella hinzii]AKQ60734.1 Cytochrome c' [Bordetella hinzii]AZW18242.1 cytochrome C [Bordetella hinzii]KCB21300.1 cytochrome C' [Bordetella hinzii OH87 BAL007II]KCB27400.1 cytochrome C' [Bordetella hinzii CA90 BAL1384]
MKKLTAFIALACAAVAMPAAAQFAKPQDAVKYRQAALTVMASHFSRMQPVVRGQAPYDAAQIKANVDILKTLAALPWAGFGPGTEGGDAKPEVWSNAADFKDKQQRLVDNVGKLSAAADSGDLAKVRAAFGDVGASCKACHDVYRKK